MLDVAGELARAEEGLGSISVTRLASGGKATVNNLSAHLRHGYDILYLVCHGALIDGEPWLWLEDETGRAQKVAGLELVTRLVVLASCQSAGSGAEARRDVAPLRRRPVRGGAWWRSR